MPSSIRMSAVVKYYLVSVQVNLCIQPWSYFSSSTTIPYSDLFSSHRRNVPVSVGLIICQFQISFVYYENLQRTIGMDFLCDH